VTHYTLRLQISSVVGDFPLVHPAMYGKPTRYAYTAVTDVKDDAAQVKVGSCVNII
jgi:carotenoid cleavage dioxygenase-like enzyme